MGSWGRHCDQYLADSAPTRPNKITQLDGQTGRKRRRFDEDYKLSLVVRVQQGEILSANAVGKNSQDFDKGSCHDWRLEILADTSCAAWVQYRDSEVISICQDGVKVGNPLEETDCYLVWGAKADNAFVLAPHALQPRFSSRECVWRRAAASESNGCGREGAGPGGEQ